MTMMNKLAGAAAKEPAVPVSFRLSTYWKLPKGTPGVTHMDSRRISLPEAVMLLMQQLADDEAVITSDGEVSTIVIDWSKVPAEVRNPFAFGVRR
jgi:hypothetical protein